MKLFKLVVFSWLTVLGSALSLFAQPSNCPASPEPIEISQPDGSRLWVIGKGNMELSYTETVDGYTIVKNTEGIFEYAIRNSEGDLLPSGIRASNTNERGKAADAKLNAIGKHLRLSEEKASALLATNRQIISSLQTASVNAGFPTTDTNKVLVILIQYPDLPSTFTRQDFENFMNQAGYLGTGSFSDYYREASFGKLILQSDVVGWFTAKKAYNTYGKNFGYGPARALVAEAIDSAELTGVDFSQYDNNKDGKIDGLIVIHSGNGAEQGSLNQYIWSHRWTLDSLNKRTYDGIAITEYCINPETRSTVNMVGIGVFTHEFGHILGLPDLYDTDGGSEGIGNWGVMGGGGWLNGEKTPCLFEAWSKIKLGWQTSVELTVSGYYSLPPAETNNVSFMIKTISSDQYFLLENRQRKGYDTFLPGNGLAIWHINKSKTDAYPGANTVNANESDKGVDLEEADFMDELDLEKNRGNSGDLFPGSKNNTSFDNFTYPSSALNDGTETGVCIYDIKEDTSGVISFYYGKMFTGTVSLNADQLKLRAYPNPFRDQATIEIYLPQSEQIEAVVLNAMGQEVARICNGQLASGKNEFSFSTPAAGIYFVKVQGKNFSHTLKLVRQ
jgi:M6 family metalloprotease-like protein